MNLSGNTILITGGTSGIGLALAKAFLTAGSEVIICGRRETRLREAQERDPRLHIRACDLSSLDDCRALAAWVGTTFPEVNILVNNAGIQRDVDLTRGIDEFLAGESEIRVNLEAPVVLSALFVPLLQGKLGAAILNVTSGLGFVPGARVPVYSATKAGLHAFSLAMRHQLSKVGIRVHEIVPPVVDTELNPEGRTRRINLPPGPSAEVFAAAVLEGLATDQNEIGYGISRDLLRASRTELDERFEQANKYW